MRNPPNTQIVLKYPNSHTLVFFIFYKCNYFGYSSFVKNKRSKHVVEQGFNEVYMKKWFVKFREKWKLSLKSDVNFALLEKNPNPLSQRALKIIPS